MTCQITPQQFEVWRNYESLSLKHNFVKELCYSW